MNLKEGTRRLALLLGAVGAILGGVASYAKLQTVIKHNEFEAFENSRIVLEEGQQYTAEVQQERSNYLAEVSRLTAQMPPVTEADKFRVPEKRIYLGLVIESISNRKFDRFRKIERQHSDVDKGNIKVIGWTKDYGIKSIDESMPDRKSVV